MEEREDTRRRRDDEFYHSQECSPGEKQVLLELQLIAEKIKKLDADVQELQEKRRALADELKIPNLPFPQARRRENEIQKIKSGIEKLQKERGREAIRRLRLEKKLEMVHHFALTETGYRIAFIHEDWRFVLIASPPPTRKQKRAEVEGWAALIAFMAAGIVPGVIFGIGGWLAGTITGGALFGMIAAATLGTRDEYRHACFEKMIPSWVLKKYAAEKARGFFDTYIVAFPPPLKDTLERSEYGSSNEYVLCGAKLGDPERRLPFRKKEIKTAAGTVLRIEYRGHIEDIQDPLVEIARWSTGETSSSSS